VDVDNKVYPHNFGDWYGVEQGAGYLASLTENITYMETHTQRSQQFFGVNYFIGTEPKFPDQELVMQLPTGVKLFRSADVFPRTWVVHKAVRLKVRRQTTGFISDKSNDLHTTTSLLENPPELQDCTGDSADLRAHASGRVQIVVNANCRGMVILTDTYYPGWHATVDSKPAKIWEAYGVVRGVVVDKGTHVVDMVYRPASVLWGAALTALGFVLSILVHFVRPRAWLMSDLTTATE